MRALPFAAAALAALVLSACNQPPSRPQVAAPRPVTVDVDRATPGAVDAAREIPMNSDNQPVFTRSGITSDPARPDGLPAPQTPSRYDNR